MNLNSLTDWIVFLASEEKFYENGNWTVRAHAYDDTDATLFFEHYSHRAPSPANPAKVKQYIIANDRNENQLFSNILFLADHAFKLDNITQALAGMALREEGAVLLGRVAGGNVAVMEFLQEQ